MREMDVALPARRDILRAWLPPPVFRAVVGELDRRQLLNYLRATGIPLGLLLHFGAEPNVLRVINTDRNP